METTTPTIRTFADHLRTALLLVVASLLALTASVVVAESPAYAGEPWPGTPTVHRTGRQIYNQCHWSGGVVEADPPGPDRRVHCVADGSVLFTDSEIPAYIDPLLQPPAKEQLHRASPHRIYRFRS